MRVCIHVRMHVCMREARHMAPKRCSGAWGSKVNGVVHIPCKTASQCISGTQVPYLTLVEDSGENTAVRRKFSLYWHSLMGRDMRRWRVR